MDQVLVALFLPPLLVAIPPSFPQAFASLVVLIVSPVELSKPPVGLVLGLVVLPFLSMWEI